jgi:hypothetical protein
MTMDFDVNNDLPYKDKTKVSRNSTPKNARKDLSKINKHVGALA